MATEFKLKIYSPGSKLLEAQVTEVILPAFDGECGILAKHQDFVGLLGTGPLKLVRDGNDYWFMISSGVFEVKAGNVTVLTEFGESPDTINIEQARIKIEEAEAALAKKSSFEDDHSRVLTEYQRAKARIEVHRRTDLVN